MSLAVIGAVVALLACIPCIPLLFFWRGTRLPEDHKFTKAAILNSGQMTVWKLVTDVAGSISWRTTVVTIEPRQGDKATSYIETYTDGRRQKIQDSNVEACKSLQRSIQSQSLAGQEAAFKGEWTLELSPIGESDHQCLLRITEHGTIRKPLYRFFAHYMFGFSRNVDRYLKDLKTEVDRIHLANVSQVADVLASEGSTAPDPTQDILATEEVTVQQRSQAPAIVQEETLEGKSDVDAESEGDWDRMTESEIRSMTATSAQ
ncbi:hypothetical protein BZG36_04046 [Bifiguratus adelaidae]|uniref:Uncharacterized protein n=1 Tax=Bifiguratus adelaidae TaxID=1938954 RepID=A0A261Y033_9FUNG|nr:hypothetical protein BZG36_04046 [Bifiguratus adelaidae]